MPRRPRGTTGGDLFHVLKRAVGRATIFEKASDYAAFEHVLQEARDWVPTMRWLDFCVMPNHWHLVVWPRQDGDLSEYLRWLTVTHTSRWHVVHDTTGTGPLYQGRFKSFPMQEDDHFFTVCRYVQRNAFRANLVPRAEQWRWSSLWHRMQSSTAVTLDPWPVPPGSDWSRYVNQPETAAEFDALRRSVVCGRPFGDTVWQQYTARQLGLESSLRQPGRPRKQRDEQQHAVREQAQNAEHDRDSLPNRHRGFSGDLRTLAKPKRAAVEASWDLTVVLSMQRSNVNSAF